MQITDSHDQLGSGNGSANGKRRDNLLADVVSFIASITFYLSLVAVSGVYLGYYVFGELGRGTGRDILAVLIMVSIVTLPTIIWKRQTKSKKTNISRRELTFTIVMLVLWAIASILAVIMLKGVCICVFN